MTGRIVRVATAVAVTCAAAAALAQVAGMQPGQWEIVSTTTAAEMPGAPPAVAAMMRGRATTIRHCVTAQEVADGPQAAMRANKSCAITYHMGAGGRFTSDMTCRQGGGTMTATSSGTMSATAFSSSTRMTMAGAQPMTMTSTATGRRTGDCKG